MKKYEVEETFIQSAYNAACPEWKKKIKKKFPDAFLTSFERGQRFTQTEDGGTYILAAVTTDEMSLINLSCGNRYVEPVKVKDITSVTAVEFHAIAGGAPELFEPVRELRFRFE